MSSSSSGSSSDGGIGLIKEMPKLANSNEAKALLSRLVAYVKPLCKQRKYRVESLNEFWPDQKGLLGMNVSRRKILIRLRHPDDVNQFYHWEFVLGTLIHELTHMEIGEHSAAFYKLMDQLHDEVEKLQNDPTTGMSDNYNTLGGGKVSKDKAAIEAGKAAIKRFQSPVMGSVNVLGGATLKKPPTKEELRKLAADAAERRSSDNKWCPNEAPTGGPANSKDSNIGFIQCILCEVFNESALTKCRVCDSTLPKHGNNNNNDNNDRRPTSSSHPIIPMQQEKKRRKQNEEVVDLVNDSPVKLTTCIPCSTQWKCSLCTLLNDDNDKTCAACETKKVK